MEIIENTSKHIMGQKQNLKGNEKSIESNEYENITYQNMWHPAKGVLKEKFIVLKTHIRKDKRSQVVNAEVLNKNLANQI